MMNLYKYHSPNTKGHKGLDAKTAEDNVPDFIWKKHKDNGFFNLPENLSA